MNELNHLATKVKRLRGKALNSQYLALREGLGGVIANVRKSFAEDNIARIDFDSIVDMAILDCLKTFDGDKGRFDYHAHRWIREYLKREIIRTADIKLPFVIANLNYKISREDRDLLLDPEKRELLMKKYGLTARQYDSLSIVAERWRTSVEFDEESIANSSPMDEHLSSLDEDEEFLIRNLFGLNGEESLNRMDLSKYYRVTPTEIDTMRDEILAKLRRGFE